MIEFNWLEKFLYNIASYSSVKPSIEKESIGKRGEEWRRFLRNTRQIYFMKVKIIF